MYTTATPDPEPTGPQRIVELVKAHTPLQACGNHQLRGRCPFCGFSAFRVRPAYHTFHCFSCGEGGDTAAFATALRRRDRSPLND